MLARFSVQLATRIWLFQEHGRLLVWFSTAVTCVNARSLLQFESGGKIGVVDATVQVECTLSGLAVTLQLGFYRTLFSARILEV